MANRQSDSELVALALKRDQRAFAEIYNRYADAVFDLCCVATRKRTVAETASAETFLGAWTRLGDLRDPAQLRLWLFAIARDRMDQHSGDPAPSGADGTNAAQMRRRPAWAALAVLSPSERLVLALQFRAGLELEEIAAVMSGDTDTIEAILEEANAAFDDALASANGTGRSRRDPQSDDANPYDPDAAFVTIRKFSADPILRARVLDDLGHPPYRGDWSATRNGFPGLGERLAPPAAPVPVPTSKPRATPWLVLAAVLLVLILGGAGWFIATRSNERGTPSGSTTPLPSTSAPPTTTPVTTPATSITITEVTVAPERVSSTECPGSPQTVTVSVATTGPSAVASASVTASLAGGSTTVPMASTETSWSGTVGPFPPGRYGSITLRVTVTDETGATDATTRFVQLTRACT